MTCVEAIERFVGQQCASDHRRPARIVSVSLTRTWRYPSDLLVTVACEEDGLPVVFELRMRRAAKPRLLQAFRYGRFVTHAIEAGLPGNVLDLAHTMARKE